MFSRIFLVLCCAITFNKVLANPNLPGGVSSVSSQGVQAFSLPAKGLKSAELTKFMVGNSIFRSNWVASPASVKSLQGLGPMFNSRSCTGCHANDGRSSVGESEGIVGPGLLFRISIMKNGVFAPHPVYGDQIQPQGIVNVKGEATAMVKYEEITGSYNDGTTFKLRKPTYWLSQYQYGDVSEKIYISPRVAPQMIGLGLLENIPEKEILKNTDPEDRNQDGISGKANFIPGKNKKRLGRFGWKANQPDLKSQNSGALLGDLGITSSLHPEQNCTADEGECLGAHKVNRLEINDEDLDRLTFYTQVLAVPIRRNSDDPSVKNGEKLFKKIGCINCHTAEFQTGVSSISQLNQQKIYPYTDLLLHDLGNDLADERGDFLADGKEWRTPPLWGIGLIKVVNRHQNLLHDARARNTEEAILWHGGEAQKTREQFMFLNKNERSEVIKFVESL